MKQNIILKVINSKHSKCFRNLLNNDHYNNNKYKEYLNNDINESTFDENDVWMNVKLFTSFNVLSINEEKDIININNSALQKMMISLQ